MGRVEVQTFQVDHDPQLGLVTSRFMKTEKIRDYKVKLALE